MIQAFYKRHQLASIFIGAFILRLIFLFRMPAANDEAFYLYDAFNINLGLIPFADFLTKSVPFIYFLALWQKIFGTDLLVARIGMICISLLSGYILYLIMKHLDKRIALITLIIFLLDSFNASRSVHVTTNYPFILCYLLTFLSFIEATKRKNAWLIIATGLLFTITFFVRQIAAFLIPFFAVYIILENKLFSFTTLLQNWKKFIPICIVGITFVILFLSVYFVSANYVMGYTKTNEFTGVSFIVPSGTTVGEEESGISENPFSREKLFTVINAIYSRFTKSPLILASFFLGIFAFLLKYKNKSAIKIVVFLLLLGINFYLIYHIKSFLAFNIKKDIYLAVYYPTITLLVAELIFSQLIFVIFFHDSKPIKLNYRPLILAYSGIALLFLVYSFYLRFDYSRELYPFYSIIAGWILYELLTRIPKYKQRIIKTSLFLLFFSFYISFVHIDAGAHRIADVYEISNYIEENSTKNDTVFTGFPIFALQAHRKVPLNISHPAWYGYAFMDGIRDEFLPTPEEYYNNLVKTKPKFAVVDTFTSDSYLARYAQINDYFSKNYIAIKHYNKLTLYKHK